MRNTTGSVNRANPSLSEHKDAAHYRLNNSPADKNDPNPSECEVTETKSSKKLLDKAAVKQNAELSPRELFEEQFPKDKTPALEMLLRNDFLHVGLHMPSTCAHTSPSCV